MIPEEIIDEVFDGLEWMPIAAQELDQELEGFFLEGAEPIFDSLDRDRVMEDVILYLKRPGTEDRKLVSISSAWDEPHRKESLTVSVAHVPMPE